MKILFLMIVKKNSLRLKRKNLQNFFGESLFMYNLKKICKIKGSHHFCIDSDCLSILRSAKRYSCLTNVRDISLRGHEVPSIPIFKSVLKKSANSYDYLFNVQANSPNVHLKTLKNIIRILKIQKPKELITKYSNGKRNGSVWCFDTNHIFKIKDFYNTQPDYFQIDNSVDIHTRYEFEKAKVIEKLKFF